jgi:hypothetical protein
MNRGVFHYFINKWMAAAKLTSSPQQSTGSDAKQ